MTTLGRFKRDDVVVEGGYSTTFYLVLACGRRTYDLIEICGGTTRYRHDQNRHVRLATPSDFGDAEYEAWVREHLRREAERAREERRTGAGVRRGHVSPRR